MEHLEFHGAEDENMQRHVKDVEESAAIVRSRHAKGEGNEHGPGFIELGWVNYDIEGMVRDGETYFSVEEFREISEIAAELLGLESTVSEEHVRRFADYLQRYREAKSQRATH